MRLDSSERGAQPIPSFSVQRQGSAPQPLESDPDLGLLVAAFGKLRLERLEFGRGAQIDCPQPVAGETEPADASFQRWRIRHSIGPLEGRLVARLQTLL